MEQDNRENLGLSPKQVSAIIQKIQLGRRLVEDHPEIEFFYRSGVPPIEIVDELDLCQEYKVCRDLAKRAIRYSLKGHKEGFDEEPYEGLIQSKSELKSLGIEHQLLGGAKSFKQLLGIHALSMESRRELSSKFYEQGLGIARLTQMERVAYSHLAVSARGKTLWVRKEDSPKGVEYSEREFVFVLSKDPRFQHLGKGSGRRKGAPNWDLITEETNTVYHNGESVRTSNAVKIAAMEYRKGREV